MDDFVLFGNDRADLKKRGQAIYEKVEALRLTIHPDEYRLVRTNAGVDFVGFVLFADGRRKLRKTNVRRFERRLASMKWEADRGQRDWTEVTRSVRSWVAVSPI